MELSHVSHFFEGITYIRDIYKCVKGRKKHTRYARIEHIKTVGHVGQVGHL